MKYDVEHLETHELSSTNKKKSKRKHNSENIIYLYHKERKGPTSMGLLKKKTL